MKKLDISKLNEICNECFYVYTKNKFLLLRKNLMITFYCTIYFTVTLQFLNLKQKESNCGIRYLKCLKCVFRFLRTAEKNKILIA